MAYKGINLIKVVFVEKKKTEKWLASQLGCAESTVPKWCTNNSQPSIEQLTRIADTLKVNYTELLR